LALKILSVREIREIRGSILCFSAAAPGVFVVTIGWQCAQVTNYESFAKIGKNPRFSLDDSSLYANLLRVTTWHLWPGGGGTRTGVLGGKLHLGRSCPAKHGEKSDSPAFSFAGGCPQTTPRATQVNPSQSKPIQANPSDKAIKMCEKP
jgi:hypothetical protein